MLIASGSQDFQSLLPSTFSSSFHPASLHFGIPVWLHSRFAHRFAHLMSYGGISVSLQSVSSGRIAQCLWFNWWITTRPIHLQIMQRIAFGRVSYFILILFNFIFFSIKKQMPDSCLGSLTTAITVLVTGYHIRALWLKLGYQKQPLSWRVRENTGGSNFFQNKNWIK